jgi:hypothetical protein
VRRNVVLYGRQQYCMFKVLVCIPGTFICALAYDVSKRLRKLKPKMGVAVDSFDVDVIKSRVPMIAASLFVPCH